MKQTSSVKRSIKIRCNRSHLPIHHHYTLNHCILKQADSHSYLGVMLDKILSWSQHNISNIAKKALNTLNLIKHNLSDCSLHVKVSQPQMNYASVIWDPYYNSDRDKLESIQRRAARWVLSDYSRTSSVSLMLHQLSWPTLQIQWNIYFTRFFITKYPCQFQLTTYL